MVVPPLFGVVVVPAQGTGGIVEIVLDSTVGAGFLGQTAGAVLRRGEGALGVHVGAVELQLAAAAAAENIHLLRAGDQVGPVAQNPAGLA